MERTQIYLGTEELELLDRASAETGASRSELIRRAVRGAFESSGQDTRLRALRSSAGTWRGGRSTGESYVAKMRRGDLHQRLSDLGLK